MNKYRDKSDFEINKAVAVNINGTDAVLEKFGSIYISDGDRGAMVSFSPCNNPADAMQIVIENGISLFAPGLSGMWTAGYVDYETDREYGVDNYEAINKNPYRAAMEVFLMMKDAKNEKVDGSAEIK